MAKYKAFQELLSYLTQKIDSQCSQNFLKLLISYTALICKNKFGSLPASFCGKKLFSNYFNKIDNFLLNFGLFYGQKFKKLPQKNIVIKIYHATVYIHKQLQIYNAFSKKIIFSDFFLIWCYPLDLTVRIIINITFK